MRRLKFLLEKEIRQIIRNKAILRMMFVMPMVQLIILPFAADYEIKDVKLVVVDHDHSRYSRNCVEKVKAGNYFQLVSFEHSIDGAMKLIESDQADIILQFPEGFERRIIKEDEVTVYLAAHAINGVRANLGAAYLQIILKQFNQLIRQEWIQFPRLNPEPAIKTEPRYWYNAEMNYQLFMVPGILTLLLTMVGSFLATLNIVREKELGTIEQINVTPIKKYEFILAKLIPFWILSQIVLSIGLIVARVVYGISVGNNLMLIYAFNSVYMLAVLGLGLLISNYSQTQQQAVLISFFLMMVFILMGGLYTSIESMPYWAQVATWFNPVRYYVEVMRMLIIKDSGFYDILGHFRIIGLFAITLIGWAIWSYRKSN
jgi:ABC-2 type transport system permease protein